jgi:hypothetical protein
MASSIRNFRDKFSVINKCRDIKFRNKQLATLMTEMEEEYGIPAFKNDDFNDSNPIVMALYKDISNAREI